jgi:DivIVA domain-containing protein
VIEEYDRRMDITPQVINEVEFHQKMRGYDPDEVDDFLERVATAVTAMHERLREAGERSTQAERRAAELEQRLREAPAAAASSTIEEESETIRRTLVLAQRTADAAIKEAEEEAQAAIRAAREQAEQIHREAREQAQRVVTEAEAEARKSADDTRQRLVAEIIALEEARDAIRSDQSILERHVDDHRLRLRGTIADLEKLLEDPARMRPTPPPSISGVTRPDFVDGEAAAQANASGETASSDDSSSHHAAVSAAAPPPPPPTDAGVDLSEPPVAAPAAPTSGLSASTHEEDEAWARFVGDEGQATEAIRLDDAGDDAYLAELRKAMLDETGAGSIFDGGDDQRRTRFGRRR